jgi:pSer/pThr/pTyr-binding forkhead associated (FHA) protein
MAVSISGPHERSRDSRLEDALNSQTASLTLPQSKTIKIFVITGSSQGMERELSRPLMTIGRLGGGADMEIDDPEVSRLHCVVEVRRDTILLRDLRSTNGTYLGDSRVFAARLDEMSRFRIGSSLLQVSIQRHKDAIDRESPPDAK